MLSGANRRSGSRRLSVWKIGRAQVGAALAALVIAASGAIVACGESPVEPSTPVVEVAREVRGLGPLTVATAGAYHNAFLDFSFPRVRRALAAGGGHSGACRAIAQAMREFAVTYQIHVDPRSIGDDIAGSRCAGRPGRNPDPGGRFSLAGDGTTSAEFDAVAAEMEFAVEAGYSTAELSTLFDQKVQYAQANFPAEEAEVIAAAASVGLSSVDYWNANYTTQLEQLKAELEAVAYNRLPVDALLLQGDPMAARLIGPPDDIRRSWHAAAARVGAADLKGAIHGGISGWRGGWQGVLVGAVIEGGAKSAGALLAELLK